MQVNNEVRIRALLGRLLVDIDLWAKGYEEITPSLLEHLLTFLRDAINLADADTTAKLQKMADDLEQLRPIVLRLEPLQESHLIAKKMVEEVHTLRDGCGELQSVEEMEIVGQHIAYVDTTFQSGILVGKIEAFKHASREDRDRLIGGAVLRPADEQQTMIELFHDIYLTRKRNLPQVNTFYVWPREFPVQTFQRSDKQLVRIQWETAPFKQSRMSIRSMVKVDCDERIGRRVYHAQKETAG